MLWQRLTNTAYYQSPIVQYKYNPNGHRYAFLLTKQGVCEAVPHASSFPNEPPSLRAGGEAERSPQHANQQVADGNVNQEQVDGRPQHLVAAEENEHQQVVEQSESADEAQAHSHHQIPCRTQGGPVGASPLVPVPDRGTQRAVCPRAAAQAHVGHDHRGPVSRRRHTGWPHCTERKLMCRWHLFLIVLCLGKIIVLTSCREQHLLL